MIRNGKNPQEIYKKWNNRNNNIKKQGNEKRARNIAELKRKGLLI